MPRADLAIRAIAADRRVRYVVAGGLAAAVYYATFTAGWLAAGGRIPYVALALAANFVTAVVLYPVQRRFVFRTGGPWLTGFLRFYVLCLGAAAIMLIGLPLLVECAHLHVLVAQAIIIIGSPMINYQMSRLWAFRAARSSNSRVGELSGSMSELS